MYILAIDDERLALDALKSELTELFPKAEICGFQTPSEALEWAQNLAETGEKLPYAFMDIQMPGMTGLQLAKELKTIHKELKLFFCTAYSEYAIDAYGLYSKGYLLKPIQAKDIERVLDEMVTDWKLEAQINTREITVRTFGEFEVLFEGKPLKFDREKAKEMFAYLVHCRGASVTTQQLAEILWEDGPYDRKLKNRTTNVVSSLRSTLKNIGADDIIEKTWNQLALDVEKIKCDAYDYEKGDAVAVNSYQGEYMTGYDWAEFDPVQHCK